MELPPEIWRLIAANLNPVSLARLGQTDKYIRSSIANVWPTIKFWCVSDETLIAADRELFSLASHEWNKVSSFVNQVTIYRNSEGLFYKIYEKKVRLPVLVPYYWLKQQEIYDIVLDITLLRRGVGRSKPHLIDFKRQLRIRKKLKRTRRYKMKHKS